MKSTADEVHFRSLLITKEPDMAVLLRRALALLALVAAASLVSAQDQVANPYYTYWSK